MGCTSLLPLEEPHEILKDLLHGSNAKSKLFRKNIRAYNSMTALVSLGAQIDETFSKNRGVHNFWVHGSLYHRVGALLPNEARQEVHTMHKCTCMTQSMNCKTIWVGCLV